MKKIASKLGLVLAILAVASLALCAVGCSKGGEKSKLIDESKLQVALNNGYEGFEELRDDGSYYGLDIELAQMIADELGVELVIQDMEFDSVIPAVKAGTKADLGISGITITDERSKEITFTEAYYSDDQAIAVVDDGKYTKENYKEALNQEGVTIYCQLGTSGEAFAQENFPNAEIVGIPGISEMFATLAAGKCDAICQNNAPTRNIVGNYSNLAIIDVVATGEEYGIAVNKDNTELLDEVNALISKWKEDGTLDQLYLKYNV